MRLCPDEGNLFEQTFNQLNKLYNPCGELLIDSMIAIWSIVISKQHTVASIYNNSNNLLSGHNISVTIDSDRRFRKSNRFFSVYVQKILLIKQRGFRGKMLTYGCSQLHSVYSMKFFSLSKHEVSFECMRKHTIICKEEKEKKKESKKHYLYVSAMEVTTFVFLCRSLLATSVKALRLRDKKTRTTRLFRTRSEDEGVKKEHGFLNEKYRVKLSLRLLLPNRLPSASSSLPLTSSSSCHPPHGSHLRGVESDSRLREARAV